MADDTVKTFWQRPEGYLGMAVLAGVGALGIVSLGVVLPWILWVIATTIRITVGLGVLGAVAFVVTQPRPRHIASALFQMSMRAVTGWVIEIDPIGVLRNYLADLQKRQDKMRARLTELRGEIAKLQAKLQTQQRDATMAERKAQAAAAQHDDSTAFVQQRRATRRVGTTGRYAELLQKMQTVAAVLARMQERAALYIEDMADEITVKEDERKVLRAAHGAFLSALSVVRGNPDKRAMYDQAMDFLADDAAKKVGEIDEFMGIAEKLMKDSDLESGILAEDAMAQLTAWGQRGDSALLGTEQRLLLADPGTPLPAAREAAPAVAANRYDDMFRR